MFSIHDLSRLSYISFLSLIGEKLIFVEDEIIIVYQTMVSEREARLLETNIKLLSEDAFH